MSVKWILVAVVVTVVLSRYGRHRREGSTRSWWGSLIMFACFASVFMFLFMGSRGPFRDARFQVPSLPRISFSEAPSTPSPAAEVHAGRLVQAPQQYEKANHKHRTSKSAHTSSGKASSEWTVINEDGMVVVTDEAVPSVLDREDELLKFLYEHTTSAPQSQAPIPVNGSPSSKSRAPRTYRGMSIGIAGIAVGGLIVVAFLYIGYLFLDAGTRGQFTWTLRIISIIGFFSICGVVAMLRHRM